MEVVLVLFGVMVVYIFIICATEDAGIREFNGKKYRLQCVGMDVDKAYSDNINCTLGRISKNEFKKRSRQGAYTINAWVEVGKDVYSWKEDPINKEIFLRYASDYEALPQYLQTNGIKIVKEYRKQLATGK